MQGSLPGFGFVSSASVNPAEVRSHEQENTPFKRHIVGKKLGVFGVVVLMLYRIWHMDCTEGGNLLIDQGNKICMLNFHVSIASIFLNIRKFITVSH